MEALLVGACVSLSVGRPPSLGLPRPWKALDSSWWECAGGRDLCMQELFLGPLAMNAQHRSERGSWEQRLHIPGLDNQTGPGNVPFSPVP